MCCSLGPVTPAKPQRLTRNTLETGARFPLQTALLTASSAVAGVPHPGIAADAPRAPHGHSCSTQCPSVIAGPRAAAETPDSSAPLGEGEYAQTDLKARTSVLAGCVQECAQAPPHELQGGGLGLGLSGARGQAVDGTGCGTRLPALPPPGA